MVRNKRHISTNSGFPQKLIMLVLLGAIVFNTVPINFLNLLDDDLVELNLDAEENSSESEEEVEEADTDNQIFSTTQITVFALPTAPADAFNTDKMLSHHREILTPPPDQI